MRVVIRHFDLFQVPDLIEPFPIYIVHRLRYCDLLYFGAAVPIGRVFIASQHCDRKAAVFRRDLPCRDQLLRIYPRDLRVVPEDEVSDRKAAALCRLLPVGFRQRRRSLDGASFACVARDSISPGKRFRRGTFRAADRDL